MSFKQMFCKHIWKQVNVEVINASTSTLFSEWVLHDNVTELFTYNCVKCGKVKLLEQTRSIPMTTEEKLNRNGFK